MRGAGYCRICGAKMRPDDLADHVSLHTMHEGTGSLLITIDADETFDVIAIVRMGNGVLASTATAFLRNMWNEALCKTGWRRTDPAMDTVHMRPDLCRMRMVIVIDYEPAPPWAGGRAPVQVLAFGISGAAARML